MAIHEQFQLPGIGVAIQRGSINHCISFHHLLKEGCDIILLDTAWPFQITLTRRAAKAAVEMEIGQRDHGYHFLFQRSGQLSQNLCGIPLFSGTSADQKNVHSVLCKSQTSIFVSSAGEGYLFISKWFSSYAISHANLNPQRKLFIAFLCDQIDSNIYTAKCKKEVTQNLCFATYSSLYFMYFNN